MIGRLNKKSLLAVLFLMGGGVILYVPLTLFGQTHTPTPPTPISSEEIDKARKKNDEAQAEFYSELTKRLQQLAPTPSPSPAKTLRQSILENPASVLGVLGAVLAALFAALVGLSTLYVNSRTALRSQKDTQFYEALKRFGDKDSATVRSSAAGILGVMARERVGYLVRWWKKQEPYLETSFDQLISGLALEENPVVLVSIADSIKKLAITDPKSTAIKLYEFNFRLEEDVVAKLAEFLETLRKEAERKDYAEPSSPLDESLWERAASVTRYKRDQLNIWVTSYPDTFESRRIATAQRLKIMKVDEDIFKQYQIKVEQSLNTAARRLRLNDEVFSYIFHGYYLSQQGPYTVRDLQAEIREVLAERIVNKKKTQGPDSVPREYEDLLSSRVKAFTLRGQ